MFWVSSDGRAVCVFCRSGQDCRHFWCSLVVVEVARRVGGDLVRTVSDSVAFVVLTTLRVSASPAMSGMKSRAERHSSVAAGYFLWDVPTKGQIASTMIIVNGQSSRNRQKGLRHSAGFARSLWP